MRRLSHRLPILQSEVGRVVEAGISFFRIRYADDGFMLNVVDIDPHQSSSFVACISLIACDFLQISWIYEYHPPHHSSSSLPLDHTNVKCYAAMFRYHVQDAPTQSIPIQQLNGNTLKPADSYTPKGTFGSAAQSNPAPGASWFQKSLPSPPKSALGLEPGFPNGLI